MQQGSSFVPSEVLTRTLKNSANQLEVMLEQRNSKNTQEKKADVDFWKRRDDIAHDILRAAGLPANMTFSDERLDAVPTDHRPYVARAMEVIGTSMADRPNMSRMAFDLLHASVYLNQSDLRAFLHYGDTALRYIEEIKHKSRGDLNQLLPKILDRMLNGLESIFDIKAEDLSTHDNKSMKVTDKVERAHYIWALGNFSKLCLEISRQEYVTGAGSSDLFLEYINNSCKLILSLLDADSDPKKLTAYIANDSNMIGLRLTNRMTNFVGALTALGLCHFYRDEYQEARKFYTLAADAEPSSKLAVNLLDSLSGHSGKEKSQSDKKQSKPVLAPQPAGPNPFEELFVGDLTSVRKMIPQKFQEDALVSEFSVYLTLKKAVLASHPAHAESWLKGVINYAQNAWDDWDSLISAAGIVKLISTISLINLAEKKFPEFKRLCADARKPLEDLLSAAVASSEETDEKQAAQFRKIIESLNS